MEQKKKIKKRVYHGTFFFLFFSEVKGTLKW